VLLFNTGATRFGPAPIRVSGRERRRIALELLAVIGLHAAVVIWLDAQPLKLLLGYFLPLWCAYAMAMAYIYTNHMLSPLREDNDPLLTSVSLKLPLFLDCLHGNFSHHSEHHVFPGLNGRYLPLVRQLENQDFFWKLLKQYWMQDNKPSMLDWLIFEATPTDYCRAYLAAKGHR
jgi:fatty acid desaturase